MSSELNGSSQVGDGVEDCNVEKGVFWVMEFSWVGFRDTQPQRAEATGGGS
jgi:hypothetical protein